MDDLDSIITFSMAFIIAAVIYIRYGKRMFSNEDAESEGVMVCPKCNSKDIKSRGVIADGLLSPNYICTYCGYQAGYFHRVTQEEAENIEPKPARIDIYREPAWGEHSSLTKKAKRHKDEVA